MLIILTLCLLTALTNTQNVFHTPDVSPCPGEEIEMYCIIEPPTSENFSISAYISINNSIPYSSNSIDSNSIPGIDTSRYEIGFLFPSSGYPSVGARITIKSYLPLDGSTVFGCHGRYFNGSTTIALASGTGPQPAELPFEIDIFSAEIDSISSFSCLAYVQIYFSPAGSRKPIERYELYVNGILERYLSNDTNPANKALTTINMIPGEAYSLTVAAVNCAGVAPMSYDIELMIPKYTLGTIIFSYLDSSNDVPVFWSLPGDDSITTEIEYSLQVITTFIDGTTTNVINQIQEFSQPSTDTSFTFELGLESLGEREVTLNFTVNLEIISQCFVAESGSISTDTDTNVTSNIQPFAFIIPFISSSVEIAILSVLVVCCGIGNIVLGVLVAVLCCLLCGGSRKDVPYEMNAQQLVNSNSHRADYPTAAKNMGVQSHEVHYANVLQ